MNPHLLPDAAQKWSGTGYTLKPQTEVLCSELRGKSFTDPQVGCEDPRRKKQKEPRTEERKGKARCQEFP